MSYPKRFPITAAEENASKARDILAGNYDFETRIKYAKILEKKRNEEEKEK